MDILQILESYLDILQDNKGREYFQESNYDMIFHQVSAKTGLNVDKGFMGIATNVYNYSLENPPKYPKLSFVIQLGGTYGKLTTFQKFGKSYPKHSSTY